MPDVVATTTRATAVYRLRDADGNLLYVGMAADPLRRFHQHAATKQWWPLVAEIRWEWLESEEAAREHEAVVIRAEQPEYNTIRYQPPGSMKRFVWELPVEHIELLDHIVEEVNRRQLPTAPRIRRIHVVRRLFEMLMEDSVAQDRLIADLVANPPRDTGGRRFVRG